jgi:GAF domain-containing protein
VVAAVSLRTCAGDIVPTVNTRLEHQRLQVLHDLHLIDVAPPDGLDDLCRGAQERFDVAMVLVTLVYCDKQVVWARAGTDLETTPRSDAFCDHLIRRDEVLVVPDARVDDRFASNPLVTGEPFIRFYAGAPLIFSRDLRLGGLCLLDTQPREFSEVERTSLTEMADEVMFRVLERELRECSRQQ